MNLDLLELAQFVHDASAVLPDKNAAMKIFSLIDLTSLNEADTDNTIIALCKKAVNNADHVAAICIYPKFVKHAKEYFRHVPVKLATVANFPQGMDGIDKTILSIQQSITHGAEEIDVVFPYQDFLKGNNIQDFISACKKVCGKSILLKVILETGAIKDPHLIAKASEEVLIAGADFVKTSTGKISQGATLEAAACLLLTIRELTPTLKRPLGFKASGGVRTLAQAMQYIALAEAIMGKGWVTPASFRLGASQLVDEILGQP